MSETLNRFGYLDWIVLFQRFLLLCGIVPEIVETPIEMEVFCSQG